MNKNMDIMVAINSFDSSGGTDKVRTKRGWRAQKKFVRAPRLPNKPTNQQPAGYIISLSSLSLSLSHTHTISHPLLSSFQPHSPHQTFVCTEMLRIQCRAVGLCLARAILGLRGEFDAPYAPGPGVLRPASGLAKFGVRDANVYAGACVVAFILAGSCP